MGSSGGSGGGGGGGGGGYVGGAGGPKNGTAKNGSQTSQATRATGSVTGPYAGGPSVTQQLLNTTLPGQLYTTLNNAAMNNNSTKNAINNMGNQTTGQMAPAGYTPTAPVGNSPYYQGGSNTVGANNTVSNNTGSATSPATSGNSSIIPFYQSDQYKNAVTRLGDMVNQNSSRPFLDLGQKYANTVLSDNYSALTPEQQQKMISDQTKLAQEGFNKTRNNIGQRLANQGLAGSGVSGMDWGGQAANENKAIADIVSNVGNQNLSLTQQNKSQALGMLPSLSSMSNQPIQNQLLYTNLLGGDDSAKNAFNQWSEGLKQGVNQNNKLDQRYADQQNAQNVATAANMALKLMSK